MGWNLEILVYWVVVLGKKWEIFGVSLEFRKFFTFEINFGIVDSCCKI